MCEAFPGALPTDILEERDRLPVGLLEEVVEARRYDRAYAVYQLDPKCDDEMVQTVKVIEFELMNAEIAAKQAEAQKQTP